MPSIFAGSTVTPRVMCGMEGEPVHLPHPERLVHLQFRRFVGCPFCSLHLHSIAERVQELEQAGVSEVAVFRSTAAELRQYDSELPFPVVPDPHERLYAEFGVPSGWRAVLNPRAWVHGLRGLRHGIPRLPPRGQGALGLPADFLISPEGRVLEAKIGAHAYDQWSVQEILQLARRHR